MNIKGKNQHVIPNETGWCVIDEANQNIVQHFNTEAEALAYAQKCAHDCESEVLVHTSSCDPLSISTVSLPQREALPGKGYVDLSEGRTTETSQTRQATQRQGTESTGKQEPAKPPHAKSDFDPMLGYDEYYFDL